MEVSCCFETVTYWVTVTVWAGAQVFPEAGMVEAGATGIEDVGIELAGEAGIELAGGAGIELAGGAGFELAGTGEGVITTDFVMVSVLT
jgi:hypothetical protein